MPPPLPFINSYSMLSPNITFVGVIPISGFALGTVEAGGEDKEREGKVDEDDREVANSNDCVVDTDLEVVAPCT